MRFSRLLWLLLFAPLMVAAAGPKAKVADHAGTFERIAMQSQGLPYAKRAVAIRKKFDRILPGLYTEKDDPRIIEALKDFPNLRPAYLSVERRFENHLDNSVRRFRAFFPGFTPEVPIYLVHSLGTRDGGTDHVAGRKVMIFGADVIADQHYGESLQPFFDHEIFKLEHARHFAGCGQLWCPLWQEGLATYAASVMTPGASDHQLLLDMPEPVRPATEARWGEALCWISGRFGSTREREIQAAFTDGLPLAELPPRFANYVGLRIAIEAAKRRSLPQLARLDGQAARPIIAAALGALIAEADAPCAGPAGSEPPLQMAQASDQLTAFYWPDHPEY